MSKGPGPGFILLTLTFLAIFVGVQKLQNIKEVRKNWENVRCQPQNMFFANFYGFDVSENVEFCLKKGFDSKATEFIKPIFVFLKQFVDILITFLNSINSMRITFATLVGSVITTFQNFRDRITQLFERVKIAIVRMRFLMSRLYGTFFAVIYMALSGMTAVTNFGNTFLFRFLDTFCFDPETPIQLESKGVIPIRHVRVGDVLSSGARVTGVFQFLSDGQPMMKFNDGVVVSTNHYVRSATGSWIPAQDAPDATPIAPWSGGTTRPLICLNTSDHEIPVGTHIFTDYDETPEGDLETMEWVLKTLNSTPTPITQDIPYDVAVEPGTRIRVTSEFSRPIESIRLGDRVTTGVVVGLVQKEVSEVSLLPSGERIASGCAVWCKHTNNWVRAGDAYGRIVLPTPTPFYSLVVAGNASIELSSGHMIRDYVEVHDPCTKDIYGKILLEKASSSSSDSIH
jgi:hypothetical protein